MARLWLVVGYMTNPFSMRGISRAMVAITLSGALAGCYATAYDSDYPSETYVSTTEPVSYEGRPVYLYRDRWYFRDGRGWRHYSNEPRVLRERRIAGTRRPPPTWHGTPAPAHEWRR